MCCILYDCAFVTFFIKGYLTWLDYSVHNLHCKRTVITSSIVYYLPNQLSLIIFVVAVTVFSLLKNNPVTMTVILLPACYFTISTDWTIYVTAYIIVPLCGVYVIIKRIYVCTMTHCAGTEQVKKERKKARNWDEKWDLRWERKVWRDGAAVTCDGRLFHRRADATGNPLLPDGRQSTEYTCSTRSHAAQLWCKTEAGNAFGQWFQASKWRTHTMRGW